MAHIRTHHPISMYIAGKSTAQHGDRLITLSWKGNKTTGREAHSARCFPIPQWIPNITGPDAKFLEMLVDTVEQRQKQVAHAYVTMMLDTNGGVCNDIPADMVSPEAILAAFEMEDAEDGSRGKLSAEQIGSWFTERLAPLVMLKVMENKGWDVEPSLTSEQEKQLQQSANSYRAVLQRLAAPQPKVDVNTATMLKKSVELLGEERNNDTTARKLSKKLDIIINPPDSAEISLASL